MWIDEGEIKLGDSLIERIRDGIDQMDYLAVVLTPSSVRSAWVRKEVDIAMNQEIDGRRVKVLPLLLRKCNLPSFLTGKRYADFMRPDGYEPALTELLEVLGITGPPKTLTFALDFGTSNTALMSIKDEYRNDVDIAALQNDLELVSIKHEMLIKKNRRLER